MTDNTTGIPFKIPSLHVLEEEGRKATNELAQKILVESLANGGRIDLQRLERAGPAVRTAYMRLLSEAATSPAHTRSNNTKVEAKTQPARSANTSPKDPVTSSATKAHRPRTKVGWADRQCPDPGFAVRAFRRGMVAAAMVGTLTVFAAHLLHL